MFIFPLSHFLLTYTENKTEKLPETGMILPRKKENAGNLVWNLFISSKILIVASSFFST